MLQAIHISFTFAICLLSMKMYENHFFVILIFFVYFCSIVVTIGLH